MINEIYKSYDKGLANLRDIYFYLPYIPQEDYSDLEEISVKLEEYRNLVKDKIPVVLISLKNYTECKCSWERSGELSDLHIFGLREYCKENGVDWGDLRIDEYYGRDKEEDVVKIIESWKKLDPQGTMQPINYTGDSRYLKYPILQSLTETEKSYIQAKENYYQHKASFLLSEWILEYYKLIEEEKNKGHIVTVDKRIIGETQKILQGLTLHDEKELSTLENILKEATRILSSNNEPLFEEAITYINNNFKDNYYDYKLKGE